MIISPAEFQISVRGWQYQHWQPQFYPEDLPVDWWFSYFSNEFGCVLVPTETLRDSSTEQVETWAEDCSAHFEFYVEVTQDTDWEHIKAKIQVLANQLAGILIVGGDAVAENKDINKVRLAALISHLIKFAPVFVAKEVIVNIDIRKFTRCDNVLGYISDIDDLSPGWAQELNSTIVLINSKGIHDAKNLRKMLESCLLIDSLVVYSLFFAGVAPKIEDLRTSLMIYEMLI